MTQDQAIDRAAQKAAKVKAFLKDEALKLGFADLRVCSVQEAKNYEDILKTFIQLGYHGSMEWMRETLARRSHPQNLWSDVQSVIMLGMNYGPDQDPRSLLAHGDKANISVYARNRDYHDLIKGRLKQLASKLVSRTRDWDQGIEVKVFVDTAPVMEKPLAHLAGLGWQGKHTNLVSRDFGSWLFLGSIFTSLALEPDKAEIDRCGSCNACQSACPTDAFPAPYKIDGSRCISYLTIENKEEIPSSLRKAMGNRIYGCDDCLSACPWNKFAQQASEIKLIARDDLTAPDLADFLRMDEAAFRSHFSGSPVKRIGWSRFLRNCLVAAGNSACDSLIQPVLAKVKEEDALIRQHAVWALGQLLCVEQFAHYRSQLMGGERDPRVLQEWQLR
ncbi:MAG: tRNA epoxyqueuosine(34) reductase QueG [Cohaesibacter sp.]|nr:tRNA epoxyqueuosine(34) reductase QueG [Cohaesibacter sp.]MCV6602275.1 tRNA epoxyqueuosine(34) reductase QueG [Cohaesibacter sp.]